MIRPLLRGIGFSSTERLPEYAGRYREEEAGRLWHYYITPINPGWPQPYEVKENYVIDGFSPNLNKSLHVGHLRQLAVANSLKGLLNLGKKTAKFVSLLGASQGVYKFATDALNDWFEFLNFESELYYDVLMPRDMVECRRQEYKDGVSMLLEEHECPWVWDGPNGIVIVKRADGSPLYAFHDLVFAKLVSPTHYVTGAEQREHFLNLGFGDKHLPMGLVLGSDGKKLKSRPMKDGIPTDSPKAEEIMTEVVGNLEECPEKRKLAWNVLAWNFLQVSRSQNVKYNPVEWTRTDAPGMYISYTFARVKKALSEVEFNFEEEPDFTQSDAELIGFADYFHFYRRRCVETMDSTQMATFAHDLARKLGKAYHQEKIRGGRMGFQHAVFRANCMLSHCLYCLGMFHLEEI